MTNTAIKSSSDGSGSNNKALVEQREVVYYYYYYCETEVEVRRVVEKEDFDVVREQRLRTRASFSRTGRSADKQDHMKTKKRQTIGTWRKIELMR